MDATDRNRRTWKIGRPMGVGVVGLLAIIGIVGVWGANAEISGAVIGLGKVEVSTSMTAVQHPIGGVVAEILTQNGRQVQAGDVVLRLDDTQLRSDLTIVESDLFEVLAGLARLEAIVENRHELILHPFLADAAMTRPEVQALVDRQAKQLAAHYESLETKSKLLGQQISQVGEQVLGTEAELESVVERRIFIETELQQTKELATQGLVKLSVLYVLEKEALVNKSDNGRLSARIAELRAKIAELELQRLSLLPDAQEKIAPELDKIRPEKTRLMEKRNAAIAALAKMEIRAPISGVVHDSKVQGVRSVVLAASPLMYVIPTDDPVLVALRIFATDIDQVFVGQEASLKFKAFNGRKLPIILGTVRQVSADAFTDPVTQKPYYDVIAVLSEAELAKLDDHELIPGMPVEAFMATQSRTPLSYVVKPLADYLDRAFRDS